MQGNLLVSSDTIRHCSQRSYCIIYNYKKYYITSWQYVRNIDLNDRKTQRIYQLIDQYATLTNINVPNQTLFHILYFFYHNIQIAIATSDVKNSKEVVTQWITNVDEVFIQKENIFIGPDFGNSVGCITPHKGGFKIFM